MRRLITFLFLLQFSGLLAQPDRQWLEQQAAGILPEAVYDLADFLRIPNNGRKPNDILANMGWCFNEFKKRGFYVERLDTDGAPLLYAELIKGRKAKTVLFYLQIDGQPVDSAEWNQSSPYEPVIKVLQENQWEIRPWEDLNTEFEADWRIFARSSSDSKGPAVSLLKALDILRLHNLSPEYNVKVIMDFQEELGSPDLPAAVEKYREKLGADFLCIMDGTRHISNLPTLTFGARGIATITLKIFGPISELHSGQYGNYAPNPVFEASRLIAGMKDESGRVLIPGFYDGIELTDSEKEVLSRIPEDEEALKQRLGIRSPDQVGDTYQEALQYPSLNIRGMNAAWTGSEVRTIIPSEVVIEIDMRLVPETPGEEWVFLVRDYVESSGFHLVDTEPTEEDRRKYSKLAAFSYRVGSLPFRTSFDSPINRWLSSAFHRAFGDDFVRMRTTGGSQPMAPFINALDVPAVSIRIPNPDNQIHAPNENLRIGNLEEGIISCLAILTEKIR